MSKLQRFDPMKARGIKTAPTSLEARGIKPAPAARSKPSGRDADPRRTIPLNSSRWRRLRHWILGLEPLCRHCNAVATEVDHISGDPSDNSRENLQGLCKPCHSHKTGRERAGLAVVHGHDENGMPKDPDHPWNIERRDEKSPEGESRKTGRHPSLQLNGQD